MRKRQALVSLSAGFAVLFIAIALAAGPMSVFAADANYGSGLVPCGATPNLPHGDPSAPADSVAAQQAQAYADAATSCQACYLVDLIQRVINYMLGLAIPISMGLFAYAGVLYFTSASNPHNIDKAKEIFKDAAIGFIIALAAYVIVDTIMRTVLAPDFYASWNHVDCTQSERPRDLTIEGLLGQAIGDPKIDTNGTGTGGASPSNGGLGTTGSTIPKGTQVTFTTIGPDGSTITQTFTTDRDLSGTYDSIASQYGADIQAACQNSVVSNCGALITAIAAQENAGLSSGTSGQGALGIMQLLPANGGANCTTGDNACISGQFQAAVSYLNNSCQNNLSNLANCVASYNGGAGTTPGSSANGKNPAFATSVNCQGNYAWQCATNPGGLSETQTYVANVCGVLKVKGAASC